MNIFATIFIVASLFFSMLSPFSLPQTKTLATSEAAAPNEEHKALQKAAKYLATASLIRETLFRYCQLCSDIPTTYSLKLETHFGERSSQYDTLMKAYALFAEDINPLIDDVILPKLDCIKEEIENVITNLHHDSEKNYEVTLLQIKQELNQALRPLEAHILKVAQALGLKQDFIFKICTLFNLKKKSYFSLDENPHTYLEKTQELIRDVHERIEYTLSTKAKTPAQKLYAATFKNPEIEKFLNKVEISWTLLAALLINPISAFDMNEHLLKKVTFKNQFSETLKNFKNIFNPHIMTQEDQQLLQKLTRPIQTSHLSFSKEFSQCSTAFPDTIKHEGAPPLQGALKVLEAYRINIEELQSAYYDSVVQLNKVNQNDHDQIKQCKSRILELTQELNSKFNCLQRKNNHLLEELKRLKQSYIEQETKEFDINKISTLELLIENCEELIQRGNHNLKSEKIRNLLLEKEEEKKCIVVETMQEKERLLELSRNRLVQLKEVCLLAKQISTFVLVVIKILKEARGPLEKFLDPEKQDRLEKLGIHQPYGSSYLLKQQEEKSNQAWIRSRALVKPKVTFDQVIGKEEILQKLEAQIQFCKDPLPYRDTKLQPIILCGEPGTGKTFTAEAIADACGRNLYKLEPQMIDPQTLRSLFDVLQEDAPCVLLIDEAHRYFRVNEKGQMDRDAAMFHSYLVPRLNEAANKFRKFLVIFATNTPTMLAGDLWRRCCEIWLSPPSREQRNEKIKKYIEENHYTFEEESEELLLQCTHGMNFDDLTIILDTLKNHLIRTKETTIDKNLIQKGLKSVYQHKLKAITFSSSLSREDLLDQFITIPYKTFKKYIEEWQTIRRPLKLKDINATIEKIEKQKLDKKNKS